MRCVGEVEMRAARSLVRRWQAGWVIWLCLLLACVTGQPNRPTTDFSWEQEGGEGNRLAEPRLPILPASGLAAPPTRPPQPLTVARLLVLANNQGIGLIGPRVTRNRAIGRALQLTVGRSIGLPENTRHFPTSPQKGSATTVPDGVLGAGRILINGKTDFRPQGAFLEVVGGDVIDFLEVKARSSPITLSIAQGQIRRLIEAVHLLNKGSRPLWSAQPPRPALLLVTTAGTLISSDIATGASRQGVAVYHAIVLEVDGWLSLGPFRQLTGFADVPPTFQLASQPEKLLP